MSRPHTSWVMMSLLQNYLWGEYCRRYITQLPFFPTRLSVTISNAIQPIGQTTTTPACTIWTARVWPTGAKMHTPITSPCPTHPSSKTKLHSWPQIASSLRWVNIYWKKRGGRQRRSPKNPIIRKWHETQQRINGRLSGSLFHTN